MDGPRLTVNALSVTNRPIFWWTHICPDPERRRRRAQHRSTGNRLAPFDAANQERAAAAAAASTARLQQAVHILGDRAPDHLMAVGALRLHHRHASLEELGQPADPPLTKDAVADGCVDCCRWPTMWPARPVPDTASALATDLRQDY